MLSIVYLVYIINYLENKFGIDVSLIIHVIERTLIRYNKNEIH